MTRTRNMSDLLDSSGDVKSGALDNVPASNDASALTTGTLPDGRFPATLPAASGANLTNLNPANLTGVTATATELNYVDGVTSSIQTQIDNINTDLVNDTTPQLGGNLDTNGNDINFADNDKLIFGTGSDFEITHNTANTVFKDTGAGNMRFQTTGTIQFGDEAFNETFAEFNDDGAVTLYYDNSPKLATKSDGVDITGELECDSLDVDGTANITNSSGNRSATFVGSNASQNHHIFVDASNTGSTTGIKISNSSSNNQSSFYHSGGNNALYVQVGQTSGGETTSGTNAQSWTSSEVCINEGSANLDFRVESNGNTHAFFVDAGGEDICFGKSSAALNVNGFAFVNGTSATTYFAATNTSTTANAPVMYANRQNVNGNVINFRRANTDVGNVSVTTSGTTYNTTSDRRLKTDIQPIADATDKLMQMQPVTHKWIAEPDGDAVHGFIAQDMQQICPEAVSGEDGGEEMMSMDYGRITPVLVAALQDAHRKIEQLEQRIVEMENG